MHLKKLQIQLLTIFFLAIIIVFSSQAFAQIPPSPTFTPNASSFFNTDFGQKVAVAIISSILTFSCSYILAQINKKQGSGKKLSYKLSIYQGLVKIDNDIKKNVKVFYNKEEIQNLYNVDFYVENTGNTVIKSEEIRFEFPEEARILDFSFVPEPEPEMKVEKIEGGQGLRPFEKKCKIGHIEKGQRLKVRFTATSTAETLKVEPHHFNENGDVQFEPTATTQALSDKDHLTKFLTIYILYLVVPPAFYIFPIIGETIAGVIRFGILIGLFNFIVPFSEIIADIVVNLISKSKEGRFFNSGTIAKSVLVFSDGESNEWGVRDIHFHGEDEGASTKN
ncbi:hypothetical protein BCD67_04560 [Oscillatoriales cyanobacterium USR001]|nr:hypothetical protein BCD67_04560 [Oscillatoriales cyanobacterium USR001]